MAQLNITLNQDEILQLLANDRNAAFAKLLLYLRQFTPNLGLDSFAIPSIQNFSTLGLANI